MHEVSLGYTIQDYLTGKEIEATTYEDFRQAIVKMLVERKGYPKENLKTKIEIKFKIDGKDFVTKVDIVAYDDNKKPILVILFCAGEIETYVSECVSAGRLLPDGPAKLGVVTDTKRAMLIRIYDKEILQQKDYYAIPDWETLLKLAKDTPQYQLTDQKRKLEERRLYALSQLKCACRDDVCNL